MTSPATSGRPPARGRSRAIVEAHSAFFAAGAEVATTASYQATFDGFAAHGIDRQQTAELMRRSVALAREAAAQVTGRPTWVAASVGPYGAMLADGSEYHGRYGLSVAQLRDFHRPRIEVLAAAGADVLAFETLPCAAEVEAVLSEIDEAGHRLLGLAVDRRDSDPSRRTARRRLCAWPPMCRA